MAGSILGAVAAPLIGSAVSGLFGGSRGGGQSGGAAQAAQVADPFASQRGQYQTQLSQLMSDPNSYQESAGAKDITKTAMDQESAQMASRGLSGSGAEAAALTKTAAGVASQDYNQQISNLMTMSGATSGNAGQAGQIVAAGNTADTNSANTFGGTVGKAITGTQGFQNLISGGTGDTNAGGADFGVTPGPGATFDINTF